MEKLRSLITQHSRWKELDILIERIETHVDIDFSLSLENAKALLECVGKEICTNKSVDLPTTASINAVLKQSFKALDLDGDDISTQISNSLANIGQQMGNLRNRIGLTSHGMSIDDIKVRNQSVDDLTKELLLDTTEIIACFLIRNFETIVPIKRKPEQLNYTQCKDFNEYWDETFGDFVMGTYSYPASEILFNVDNEAYTTEHRAFTEEGI